MSTIAEALRRRKLSRPCSYCGHEYLRHGIGEHAVKDHQKSGGMCIDCQKECKTFVRVETRRGDDNELLG